MSSRSHHPVLGPKSPQTTTRKLTKRLKNVLSGYEPIANFSCGGRVLLRGTTTRCSEFSSNRALATSPPVVIRWDDKDGKPGGKITFPFPAAEQSKGLEKLLQNCTNTYLGERKLEATRFSTNFNPYDCGIVNAVAQTLLPEISESRRGGEGENTIQDHWGVAAELYEMRVYSGPSKKFIPNVAVKPSHEEPFGSLLVCLPYPHEGGQLRVAHTDSHAETGPEVETEPDENLVFHFEGKDESMIQWAAFYDTSEYEILSVTSGHQIILAYRLYVSERVGGVAHLEYPTADPTLYPLHKMVQEMLKTADFMENGGILGFHCRNQPEYAHTNATANARLPYALKGLDAVVFSVFRSLGLKVHLRPILEKQFPDDPETRISRKNGLIKDPEVIRAGTKFHNLHVYWEGVGQEHTQEGCESVADEYWKYKVFNNVYWLNKWYEFPFDDEYALVWVTNDDVTMIWWSFVGILVEIPPFCRRNEDGTVTQMAEGEENAEDSELDVDMAEDADVE